MIEALMTALSGWRLFAVLAVLGTALGATFHAGRVFEGRTRDAEALQQTKADLAQVREDATENQRLAARQQAGATGATDATIQQLRGAAVALGGARDERERLRDQVAELEQRIAQASDAEPACRTHAAGAAGLQLLDACAGRYQELAGEAGELAAAVTGLQRWVSGVCAEPIAAAREGGRLDE